VALVVGFSSIGLADYLRMIGPAPLRFEPAPKPIPSGMLSRLTPDEDSASPPEISSTTSNPSPAQASLPIVQPESIVTSVKSPGLGETNESTIELMSWISPEQPDVIGPQTFLPYFRRSVGATNTEPERARAPLIFIPPTRAQRSPSKATYSTR